MLRPAVDSRSSSTWNRCTPRKAASRKRAHNQLASPILFTVYLIQALMSDYLECHGHPRPFVEKSLNWKTMRFSSCDVRSRMQLGRPHDLVLGYTRLMMGFLLFVPAPRRIAIVGLGGGSLAKFCYRYVPDSRIQVVEINPHVIALRDDFEIPRDDGRFHVCKEDAADHVRTTQSRYDVIMADGFDANGVPADLGPGRMGSRRRLLLLRRTDSAVPSAFHSESADGGTTCRGGSVIVPPTARLRAGKLHRHSLPKP